MRPGTATGCKMVVRRPGLKMPALPRRAPTRSTAPRRSRPVVGIARTQSTRQFFLPTTDEWYKAAFYIGGGTNAGYWFYPNCSNTLPVNTLSATGTNNANFYNSATQTYTNNNAGPLLGTTRPWARSQSRRALTARSTWVATWRNGAKAALILLAECTITGHIWAWAPQPTMARAYLARWGAAIRLLFPSPIPRTPVGTTPSSASAWRASLRSPGPPAAGAPGTPIPATRPGRTGRTPPRIPTRVSP